MTAWLVGAALFLLAACDQLPASGRAAVELDSALLIEGQAPEQPVSLPDAWEVTAPARDGRVRYLHRGYREGVEEAYERQVRELVKE